MRTDSVYIFSYLIILFVILLVLAGVGMAGYVIYYYLLRGWLAPVKRARARVVRKRQREWEVDVPPQLLSRVTGGVPGFVISILISLFTRNDPDAMLYDSWDYFVTFSVNGQEVEFAVPEQAFIDAIEGNEGLLVSRGTLFKHFIIGVG